MASPRRRPTDPPERGDLCEVRWCDILEHANGDPDKAQLSRRTSYGLFWAEREDDGIPVVVTTSTIDEDDDVAGQQGYVIYPKCCVLRLRVVKRVRRSTSET
jgi:hypothetical protein